jgi:hypothetical protein
MLDFPAMELVPRALVIGLFIPPPGLPGTTPVTKEVLNRIWAEVAPNHDYTQLQVSPDGSQANFVGAAPEDGVTIQPPLLQVRSTVPTTPDRSAADAEAIFKTIARHLGVSQFFNLGIRHVYHVPVPDNDARAFVMGRILKKSDADVAELEMGEGSLWGGVKFVIQYEAVYTLVIEPLVADMRNLYLDLDAQFDGPAELDNIASKAKDAETYVTQSVNRYLDRHLTGG